jgi:hypothetical protein
LTFNFKLCQIAILAAGIIVKYLIHFALNDSALISTVHVTCVDCKTAFPGLYWKTSDLNRCQRGDDYGLCQGSAGPI